MQKKNSNESASPVKNQIAIFITVLFGFVSYSLPYPIFSPLFLSTSNGILPSHYSEVKRTVILGIALILYPLGQFIGNPAIGYLSDRYGRKKLLMLVLLIVGFSDLLIGAGINQNQLWLVFLSLFLGGLCAGNITIAQSTAADLSQGEERVKSFGLINVAINVGWILGVLLGGKLADEKLVSWFNYATPFFFSGLCYGLNLILVWIAFPNVAPKSSKEMKAGSILTQLKKPGLRLLYVYAFLGFLASYYFFCYFAVFLVQKFNYGPSEIANFEAYLALPLILASYLVVKVIGRIGIVVTSFLSHFALAISFLIFLIPQTSFGLWFTVPLVAIWLSFGEITSGLLIANQAKQEDQGIAMGTYRSLLVLGELVAALTGGYLAGLNYILPFLMGAIVAAIASLLLFYAYWKKTIGVKNENLAH